MVYHRSYHAVPEYVSLMLASTPVHGISNVREREYIRFVKPRLKRQPPSFARVKRAHLLDCVWMRAPSPTPQKTADARIKRQCSLYLVTL